ncbi:two-component sensor histidine kinase [Azospirillum baldaniorum]|uniref:sensor histidine kinase n=1 Tax=Azospirillum baldaniorum TaxID=1064539 RepID=UPI00119CF693|nr:CHASE domain-containing protein [Azospirillum baldaniorum]TWA55979.1 two-component sensor histidine kinase [Azospirillum baldaniorum]
MPLRHYVPSFAATLVGIGLTVFVFGQERQQALDVQRAEFTRHADSVAGTLQRILSSRELIPTVFGGLFSADQDIQRGDLAALAERVFARMPSLVAVSWLPRTPPSQAGALLEALRQEGYAVSHLRGPNDATINPETVGRDIFPVRFIEPLAMNEAVIGMDAAAFPNRAQALQSAWNTGQSIATEPLLLVQTPNVLATILYTPVFRPSAHGAVDEARGDLLKGMIATVFRLDRLISDALDEQYHRPFHVHIFDANAPAGLRLLHAVGTPSSKGVPHEHSETMLNDPGFLRRAVTWGGREWTLLFEPVDETVAAPADRLDLVLVVGLLLTAIAAGYFALQAHNTIALEQEVEARRRAEEQKDLLIQEVNHRVRNSLQIVGTMLFMQGTKATDETVRRALDEAGARVRAIAQVHERLYRGTSVSAVEVAAYLQALSAELRASAPEVELRVTAQPIELPTDQVVPLGLIVVELVTNAIKHARPPDGNLRIDIGFRRAEGGHLELTVRDYGFGLPDGDVPDRQGRSLGMTVVRTLASQLQAELHAGNAEPGARWVVRLPMESRRNAGA